MNYMVGNTVRLLVVFRDAFGVATDPATVILAIKQPNASFENANYPGTITRKAFGEYQYDFVATQPGTHYYQWKGNATTQIISEGTFDISELSTIITAGIPELDDCKIATRSKAFIVPQGMTATLEHTFRDRKGNPMDLSSIFPEIVVVADSASLSATPTGYGKLRAKEAMASGPSDTVNPNWEITVTSPDPANGILQAILPANLVENSGLYRISWGVFSSTDKLLGVDDSFVLVERSLFPSDTQTLFADFGPPTIKEIRQQIMDSSASENILLDDVEFSDDQILHAMTKPVEDWNLMSPPISTAYHTTRSFPYREPWLRAIAGHLHVMSANHYRRNRLAHQAGGVAIDDKNKEREYMAEGQRLLQEYAVWCQTKKIEINTKLIYGIQESSYTIRYGW